MPDLDIKSTRLRYIAAQTADIISLAVSSLPFKVEIKGNPVPSGDGLWYVWFIIPDNIPSEFPNTNLGVVAP